MKQFRSLKPECLAENGQHVLICRSDEVDDRIEDVVLPHGKNCEIPEGIVSGVTVDMVDMLGGQQGPTEKSLDDEAVFSAPVKVPLPGVVHLDEDVSVLVGALGPKGARQAARKSSGFDRIGVGLGTRPGISTHGFPVRFGRLPRPTPRTVAVAISSRHPLLPSPRGVGGCVDACRFSATAVAQTIAVWPVIAGGANRGNTATIWGRHRKSLSGEPLGVCRAARGNSVALNYSTPGARP